MARHGHVVSVLFLIEFRYGALIMKNELDYRDLLQEIEEIEERVGSYQSVQHAQEFLDTLQEIADIESA